MAICVRALALLGLRHSRPPPVVFGLVVVAITGARAPLSIPSSIYYRARLLVWAYLTAIVGASGAIAIGRPNPVSVHAVLCVVLPVDRFQLRVTIRSS